MVKREWRKRVRGTPRQLGQAFPLDGQSAQAKRANLPKATGKVRTHYPTGKVVQYTIEDMPLEQLSTQATIIQDPNPENFEERVEHFIQMYKRGETIPPILFHRLEDGGIQILDGRARMEAFRRMGIPRIPAVENGILSSIKSGISKVGSAVKTGATKLGGVAQGVIAGKGGFKSEPKSDTQAEGRRLGVELRERVSKIPSGAESAMLKTSKFVGKVSGLPQAMQEAYEGGKATEIGRGIVIGGSEGGGDMVVPLQRSSEPVTSEKPLVHRPCVIERRVKGKVLRTYGTLLDPRTNPRYMQKYGYTDIE
jgi:hypothetical protein